MGRTAKHNWKRMFLEYCQGKYKSIAEFARKKKLNPTQCRDEFRKLNGTRSKIMAEALSTENQQEKQPETTEKKRRPTDKPTQTWERLRQQFTDWPDEKLQAYLVQIESRLAELSVGDFEELTKDEQQEIGQLRRERRAILSDPDPDKICTGHRHGGEPCKNPAERGREVCWMHGGAPGTGAPFGSKNSMRHGFYSKIMPDDPELKAIIEAIDAKSPLDILWDQIVIQYAQIARAQKLMYVQDQDDIKKQITRIRKGVNPEVEYEFQYPWDRHASLLTAQSRAMGTLERLIARYEAMANDEQKLKVEKLKAEIEQLKKAPEDSEKTADMETAINEAWRKRSEQNVGHDEDSGSGTGTV